MGVVEKAGGPLNALVSGKKKKMREDVETRAARPAVFDIDFNDLEALGYFHPDKLSSPIAMELRAVKRRLLRRLGFLRASGERQAFRRPGRQRNVILITSTQAGEGKTFCAVNLALSLALEDQIETLLVDADVPRPKIRARFNLDRGPGLTDCIRDNAAWRDLTRRAAQGPLSLLGEGHTVARSAELFATARCQQLLTDMSMSNPDGLVIIDAPPALAMTDAVVLAKYVDEIVFVVEANETPEPAVASALDELLDVNPNVSLVLNRCLIGATGSSYSSYDYYARSDEAHAEGSGKGKSNGDS